MARGNSTSLWTAALAEECRGNVREDEVENDRVEREKAEKVRRMTGMSTNESLGWVIELEQRAIQGQIRLRRLWLWL